MLRKCLEQSEEVQSGVEEMACSREACAQWCSYQDFVRCMQAVYLFSEKEAEAVARALQALRVLPPTPSAPFFIWEQNCISD